MNQYLFALRNIFDKFIQVINSPETFKFYWQTYILSGFNTLEPDVYFVSYPKCGRTWLRFMLQQYLELCGSNTQQFKDKFYLGLPGGQIIKFEHDQGSWVLAPLRIDRLSFNVSKYIERKVIFMARDPRDVLVSSWYHLKFRERTYRGSLSEFIRDDLVGIHKVVSFMNMWLENSHIPDDFFLITYEQLHSDPLTSFHRLLDFIGIAVSYSALQTAVEEGSFEKMKRMELKGTLKEPWMKPGSKDLRNSMKIRRGKVGSFYEELSEEDIEFLNGVIQNKLSSKLPYHQH